MNATRSVVLLSGGLDSTTLLYYVHRRSEKAMALSFRYPSRHNARELVCAAHHAKALNIHHVVVPLDWMGELFSSSLLSSSKDPVPHGHYTDASQKSTVVPFRNGIFLSISVGLAESMEFDAVYYAAHSGDSAVYPDCRPSFLNGLHAAAVEGTYRHVRIEAPFLSCNKKWIVSHALSIGVPLEHTWTCYEGGDVPCGECGACVERRESFDGVDDPLLRDNRHDRLRETQGGR